MDAHPTSSNVVAHWTRWDGRDTPRWAILSAYQNLLLPDCSTVFASCSTPPRGSVSVCMASRSRPKLDGGELREEFWARGHPPKELSSRKRNVRRGRIKSPRQAKKNFWQIGEVLRLIQHVAGLFEVGVHGDRTAGPPYAPFSGFKIHAAPLAPMEPPHKVAP